MVPDRAVQNGPDGTYVFVVKPDQHAEQRKVGVQRMVENKAVIESGLAAGETVVLDGQSRVENGAALNGQREVGREAPQAVNVSEIFVRRPVMTTLVMVGLLVFGIVGYRQLPVAALPNVDFPTISVSASLPGASPETMASAVATPLEKQFSTIPAVDSMTSTSSLGSTSITLQFSLDRNIDAAAQDVQAAISAALRQLPPQMTTPPTFRKVNPADSPIFYIAFTSKTLRLSTLDEYAENTLAQRISTVRGVAQVNVYGSRKYAVRIDLDPDALSGRGLGIDTVADAIGKGNVNLPTGIFVFE